MGLALGDLVPRTEITLDDLKNKVLAVDTFNLLYQFLTTIRSLDGTPLQDSKGNVTSHLVGLFSRVTHLMQYDIKVIFVFDGKPPLLKEQERERRKALKHQALKEYEIAKEREDLSAMKKYASRTAVLTSSIIQEAQALISALGFPYVTAPSEGEAQVAHIVARKDAYAAVSQDYDTLLYNVPCLVRNLSITGKKKKSKTLGFVTVQPELIKAPDVFKALSITQDQFIILAILVGTDYNYGGIKGIGPKNALRLVKQYGADFNSLFKHVHWEEYYSYPWQDVFNTFKHMPVTDDYCIIFKKPDVQQLKKLLCDEHDFSVERVETALGRLGKMQKSGQKGLGEFL
ncbi:flap endonuclease-1 [Candidatus Woesearchaeota archaeon]|nr:flap endonuclease-1 [Candidatus Woesearchaeota archaeon]